ncbi:hypothetical protein VTJ83DRAFT_950 [Remersonia thermophila]|uniref:Uncharacterized protein n=1 Tax=Remersonia thermophila TaxID=72144 RepID=A0ABR4DN98_9PEZI
MAPVQLDEEPGLVPVALAVSRAAAAIYASFVVGRSLYQSHKALGPAHHTRHRQADRAKPSVAFGSLAALALVFAISSTWDSLTLSYRTWASERGIQVPERWLGSHASTTNGTARPRLHLQRWLSDTPVHLDALEIVAEKARRLWWGRQLDLATIAWTTLLAIEGRRRGISHLWAYALLPHLVSLSFAQNMFYVALLQTPAPVAIQETRISRLLHRLIPEKPKNWFPRISLLLVPILGSYLATLWLPYAANTASFPTAVFLSKLLTLAPLILPAVAPLSWGTVHPDPHAPYADIRRLFNVISAASALIHAQTTYTALRYNFPDPYLHRHSIAGLLHFDAEKRSRRERSATAIQKVLGALTDHPAVAAAGKDVLLSALSLGLWAAVRATDIESMLTGLCSAFKSAWGAVSKQAGEGAGAIAKAVESVGVSTSRHHDASDDDPDVPPLSMTLRSRDRPASTKASVSSIEDPATAAVTTSRRRGRPRKVKTDPEPEPETEPTSSPSGPREPAGGPEEEDKTYHPTPAVKADAGLGDVLPEDAFDWEPAALAWGLTAVGGLGLASAAVFGAECVSR